MLRKPSKFIGDDGANIFYGDRYRDIMEGNGGKDFLFGAGGNDRLFGGDGEDILRGGDGDDVIDGGGSRDLIFAGIGNDRVLTVEGDDFVDGGRGKKDSIAISAASDEVYVSEIGNVRIIETADGFLTIRNVELFEFDDGIKTERLFNYTGQYDLIPGLDVLQGSSGRSIIEGTFYGPDEGGNVTINDGDHIDGGAGSDVLQILVTKNGSIAPLLENIETIKASIKNASFTVDLAPSAGVRTLSLGSMSDGTFTAENVSSLVALQLDGTIGGTLAVEYSADVTSGDSDTQHVFIHDAAGAISVAGVEIMNVVSVSSTAHSNNLTVDSADLHTINIAGDARISIEGLGMTTKIIDASLAIGGVELALTHASGILATGGEADDVFDFSAMLVADAAGDDASDFAGAVVDGGEGEDIVVFASNAVDATAAKDGQYWIISTDGMTVKLRNAEMLKFADTTILVSDLDNGPLLV